MTTPTSSAAAPKAMPSFPEFVAMIASLMAMTALSIDIMLPALPQIESGFDVGGLNNQQLVVTVYLLGFSAGQVIYGPLSDRFGRRAVLIFGLALFALASLLCTLAGTFELLLAGRFLQGIANAAPRVVAIAVVRDRFGGRRMAEVMSFVMMVFILVPVVAPAIGGGIMLVGSWRLIFDFLLVVGLAVLVWVALHLPETRPREAREPLSLIWLLRAVRETVTNRQTLGYTLATGAIFGSLMGYINSSQQVFTEVYGEGELFPVLFGAVSLSLALASFVNSRLVVRLGMRRLSHGALLCFVLTGAVHLAVALVWGDPPLPLFMALLGVCLFFFGFMMPNFNALAMEPMGRIAGTASSFVGAATTGIAAVLGWYVGQHFAGNTIPLLAGYVAFGSVSLTCVLVTERGRLFGAGRDDG